MYLQKAQALASKVDDKYLKEVYGIIAKGARPATIAGDSEPMLRLSAADCRAISDCGYEHVKARYIESGGAIETPAEALASTFICFNI